MHFSANKPLNQFRVSTSPPFCLPQLPRKCVLLFHSSKPFPNSCRSWTQVWSQTEALTSLSGLDRCSQHVATSPAHHSEAISGQAASCFRFPWSESHRQFFHIDSLSNEAGTPACLSKPRFKKQASNCCLVKILTQPVIGNGPSCLSSWHS